ncbi:MAG TPA: hypothetical protein VKC57_06990 [Ktedonobacterales bacterium]|nr:hypothetical protein [Ktedonobacterales bacterium]
MPPTKVVPRFSTLCAAAALQRAALAHIAEELHTQLARGQPPAHELCVLLPLACWLADDLARLAAADAQEGGAP